MESQPQNTELDFYSFSLSSLSAKNYLQVYSLKIVQPFKLHSVCERFVGALMLVKSIKIKFIFNVQFELCS